MSTSDDGKPFDPHSAPTIMEMSPFYKPEPAEPPAPKGIGDLLKGAFELYKAHALLFIVTAAVVMGPVYFVKDGLAAVFFSPAVSAGGAALEERSRQMEALAAGITRKTEEGASAEELSALQAQMMELSVASVKDAGGMLAGLFAMLGAMLLTIPLVFLATWLAQAALVVAVSDRARGGSMTWQGAWGVVGRNAGPLLVTSLLATAAVMVGVVMCFLPGLVLGFLFAFAMPVVLLEKKSAVDALRRSFELVKSDWLRVLIVMIVFAMLNWVASAIGGMLIPNRFFFLDMLVSDLFTIVIVPVPVIGLVLLYEDLVRSKQGAGELDERRSAMLAQPGL